MEIHGCDICVKCDKSLTPSLVELIVKNHWPNMVTELDCALPDQTWLFLYKNQNAKNIWDEGVAVDDDADMIIAIWTKDITNEVWFVIDDNKILQYIVDDIQKETRQ